MAIGGPLSGSPSAVRGDAQAQRTAGEAIQEAADLLRDVADRNNTTSEAVDEIRTKSLEVADYITKARVRFDMTADALNIYADKLEAAQQRANNAIARVNNATGELSDAEFMRDRLKEETDSSPLEGMVETYERWVYYRDRAIEFGQEVVAAGIEYAAAVTDKELAAAEAILNIDEAARMSGLNDSIFDLLAMMWRGFVNWVTENAAFFDELQKALAFVGEWLGAISLVLAVLSLIPGLNAITGPLLLAFTILSAVVAVASFVITAALVKSGRRTVGDAVSTGILAAVSVVGAVAGLGSAATAVNAATRPATTATAAAVSEAQEQIVINIVKDQVIDTVAGGVADAAGGITDGIINAVDPNAQCTCVADPPAPFELSLPLTIESETIFGVEVFGPPDLSGPLFEPNLSEFIPQVVCDVKGALT